MPLAPLCLARIIANIPLSLSPCGRAAVGDPWPFTSSRRRGMTPRGDPWRGARGHLPGWRGRGEEREEVGSGARWEYRQERETAMYGCEGEGQAGWKGLRAVV